MRFNFMLSTLSLLALLVTSGCCVTVSRSGDCCSDRCSTGLQGRLFNRGLFSGGACTSCDSGQSGHVGGGCNSCASTRGGMGLNGAAGAYGGGMSMSDVGMNLPPLRGSLFGGGYQADDSGIALVGHHDGGCGRMGCGLNGRQCLGCSIRGRRASGGLLGRISPSGQHPYGGHLPHTEPIPAGFGPEGQTPTFQYPYYTTRGPRDFLQNNPPSIGY